MQTLATAGFDMFIATAVGAVLLALIARRSPDLALALWVTASVIFYSYMFPVGPLHPHPSHVLLVGLLLGFWSRGTRQLYKSATGDRPELLIVALVGWSIATACISGTLFREGGTGAVGTLVSGFLVPVVILYLAQSTPQSQKSRWIVCNTLTFFLAYLVFTAFCEHFKMDQFVFPKVILDPSVGMHLERARGPVVNAAANGGIIATLIFVALHRLTYIENRFLRFSALFALIALGLPALWFTKTRGPWVAFTAGLLVMLWHKRSRQLVLIMGGLLVVALMTFQLTKVSLTADRTDTEETTDFRLILFQESLEAFAEHPIIGWGLGSFTELDHPLNRGYRWQFLGGGDVQHNSAVAFATETGVVGLTLFLAFFFLQFRSFMWLSARAPSSERRDYYVVCVSVLAVQVVCGSFADCRFWLHQNSITFLITGLGLALPIEQAAASTASLRYTASQSKRAGVQRSPKLETL